jgi:hypothetical protein
MKLTDAQLDTINEAYWDNSNSEENEVRTGYSGRGMYGKTCIAFTVKDIKELVRVLCAVNAEDAELAGKLLAAFQTDSMGRDLIAYFPGIEAPAEVPA